MDGVAGRPGRAHGAVRGGAAHADRPPAGSTWSEAYLASRDGTRLHADVFRPAGIRRGRPHAGDARRQPVPGLLTPDDPGPPESARLVPGAVRGAIARGYSVVQVSLARHRREPAAAATSAARASRATSPRRSSGRPRSPGRPGGWACSATATTGSPAWSRSPSARRELTRGRAVGPAIDLYRGIYMNGVPYAQGRGVAPYYQGSRWSSPLTPGRDARSARPRAWSRTCPRGQDGDHDDAVLAGARSVRARRRVPVPVLWAHGFLDGRDDFSAVRPDNFLDVCGRAWRARAGRGSVSSRTWCPASATRGTSPSRWAATASPARRSTGWTPTSRRTPARASRAERSRRWPCRRAPRGAGVASRPGRPPREGHAVDGLAGSAFTDARRQQGGAGRRPGGGCDDGLHARCNPIRGPGRARGRSATRCRRDAHLAGVPRVRATPAPGAAGTQVVAIVYDVDRRTARRS